MLLNLFLILMMEMTKGEKREEGEIMDDPKGELKERFGMELDQEGVLRELGPEGEIVPGSGFQFDVYKGDKDKNQKRYEQIGEIIDR